MTIQEAMTTGVLNALNKNRNRSVCGDCGFPIPVYPGRYPSACPSCGASREPGGSDDAESEESGE